MKQIQYLLVALIIAVGMAPLAVDASGSGGYRQQQLPEQKKPVDAVYERGKALFKGRVKDYGDVRVCISSAEGGEAIKLKKKHLKPYKAGSANKLAANLYSCKEAGQKIAHVYQGHDLSALVHYLNKRYRLKLAYN